MRMIVSGGGTGGHIYPAITLIRMIKEKVQDCEVLYVGTEFGLEADIVPKEKIAFKTIHVKGFARKITTENIKVLCKSIHSIWESKKIIKEFNPDIVIGTGGYVCGPILLAASLMGIPTMIQEQNVIPGITNKILAKFVRHIAVGYADSQKYFHSDKVVFTGNPVRKEVLTASRENGIENFALDVNKKTILISGGSRGARSINNAMIDVHAHFAGNKEIQLLHVTGKDEYNGIIAKLRRKSIDIEKVGNIIIKPYLYNMPDAIAATDLAIFRSGAIGLAELTARGIPAILIPYPYAAENHQEHNALAMQKAGAGIMILDKELTGKKLIDIINNLLQEEGKLSFMAKASKALGKPNAASDIADIAIQMLPKA